MSATATENRQRHQVLPVISLLVAGAAAVVGLTAIVTDDTSSIQEPAAEVGRGQVSPTAGTTSGDRAVIHNVDGCGRPIVLGAPQCE